MANYDALINLKLKGFDELKKVEKTLNNITNPKSTRRSASQKLDQSELSFLRTKNTALTLANRAHRIQNKLKGSGRDLEKEIVDLERIGNVKQVQNLSQLKKQIELRKKDVLEAEKLLAVRTKEAKTVKTSPIVSSKTSPTVVSHPALMGPHQATKGAGQVAMSIDTITKQSDKRLRIELKLRELEAKGVNTAKLRAKMGELVDAQNRKAFGDIKLINREIGRGIAKEESKLKILRLKNKERDLENKKILEANKITVQESSAQGPFTRLSDRKSRDVQGKRTFMNNRFVGGIANALPKSMQPTRGFDFGSALISGAFPLLFGQGPIGAAAGALGGGIGGMFGQMGGFAGGIAATAIVQQIQSAITAISELGKALGPFTQNTESVVTSLGLQNSVQQAQIQLIEQVEGKTAAFNAAMKLMANDIGQRGVNALKEFGESSRILGSQFTLLITKLQALAAGAANFVLRITGLEDRLKTADATRVVGAAAVRGNSQALGLIQRQKQIDEMDSRGGEGKRKKSLQDQLDIEKQIFAIREQQKTKLGEITLEYDQAVQKNKEELQLKEAVKKLTETGMSEAIAKEVAKREQLRDKVLEEVDALADALRLERAKLGSTDKELERLKEIDAVLADILKKRQEINGETDKAVGKIKAEGGATEKIKVSRQEIADLLANETTNAIMGLIEGTKTLGDALAGIAKSLAKMFLNAAFQNIFNNLIVGQEQGGYNRAGSFKAFQYGGVVSSPTLGMIGEGGEPEYVIPSSKMSGAMARYSAGARGGAVIPGGSGASGTVAGSSGNTIVEYTGPVLNFNGDEYVPKSAVPEIINTAAKRGGESGRAQAFSALKNSRSQRATLGL